MTNTPGAMPPSNPPVPPAMSDAERRQRNIVIGLSIAAALVLLLGIIAFAATRSSGDSTATPDTPVPTSPPATETSTTSTTSTTTSTTTTTTTTTLPPVIEADAGPDLDASRGEVVTLAAVDLDDAVDPEQVRWVQIGGPDVTAGVGALGGSPVSFGAPSFVGTIAFDLEIDRVDDDEPATDRVIVRVFEDVDEAVFVDGERGSDDAGDGTREAPYQTIRAATAAASGADMYIRSVGVYDEGSATIELGDGMSLYGGFDERWNRNVADRVVIEGATPAIRITGNADRWLSALEVTSRSGPDDVASQAVVIDGGDIIHIEDSRVVAGNGGPAGREAAGAVSVGVAVDRADEVYIERSTINGGRGGDGASGDAIADAADEADDGAAGDDASGREPGDGGAASTAAQTGGDGGRGGETSNGSSAPDGGAGGTIDTRVGASGDGGIGGVGGEGGDGGSSADIGAVFGASGDDGADGAAGTGGSGGGGGFGPLLVAGGGGGGGGAGADGTPGAAGGGGGGGSLGLWVVDVDRLVIRESLIAAGRGGDGGIGADAPAGGAGGDGGSGGRGVDGVLADGGDGGGAGGGGAGGQGGAGGGGAGGPSYGMLTADVDIVEISATTIRGGGGGIGARGGRGGVAGGDGDAGSARNGGSGGAAMAGASAAQGVGASGGSSYGWFDRTGADQIFDDAEFIEGASGPGGPGSAPGDAGVQVATNV